MVINNNILPEIVQKRAPTIRARKCPLLDTKNHSQVTGYQTVDEQKKGALSTCTQNKTKKDPRNPTIIGFDWLTLQISIISNISDIIEQQNIANKFSIDPKYNVGLNWKKIYKLVIHHHGKSEVFAELETENKHESVTSSCIRFQNKFLYDKDFLQLAEDCFNAFGFKFIGISRIDLYMDFQKLNSKVSQNPENFIKQVFNGNYLKQGRASFMPFVKADLYNHRLDQYNDERLEQNFYTKGGERMNITGARWGKLSSGFQIKMYNKTLEMAEQKFKPYIDHSWKAAGFVDNLPTYRLEFTVNRKDFYSYDKTTGEIFDNMRELSQLTPEMLEYATLMLYKRHFKFHRRIVTINGKRKVLNDRKRRLPEFYPIDTKDAIWIKEKVTVQSSSGRTKKTEISNLVKDYLAVKDAPTPLADELLKVLGFKLSDSGLFDWFYKKYSELQLPETFAAYSYIPEQQLHTNQKLFQKCPTCSK